MKARLGTSDNDEIGLERPPAINMNSRRSLPGILPPTTNTRQSTFSDDLKAKDRAAARHSRRRSREEPQPGPVRVAGIGSSGDSISSFKTHDSKISSKPQDSAERLMTAIPVEDEEEALDEAEKKRIEEKAKHDVKLKIFATAVEAEATDPEVEEQQRKRKGRRKFLIFGSILFIVLAGGGAGIAVALSGSDPDPTEVPSFVPTASPTVKPPIFVPPPQSEGGENMGSPTPLDNTVCEGAFDVATVIGEAFSGSITELARVAPVDTCEVVFRNGVGVWYRIAGDGSRYMASTCEGTAFDTQISIYSGICGKLRCVAGNDQMASCGNGDQSLVGFATEPGTDYYIYVHARRQAQSLFKLLVDYLDSNDECEGAVSLEYFGSHRFDSTRGATIDEVDCFGTIPDAPGVWYKIEGEDSGFGFDSELSFAVDFDTSDTGFSVRALVFEGDCGSLTCVDTSGSWFGSAGTTYYILVYGRQGSSEGDYRIAVDDGSEFADSIRLPDSPPLFPGSVDDSSTFFRSRPRFGTCGNLVFVTAAGVWYEAAGTGGPLTVSTCDTTSGFDTQISVLQGPDDDLICIDGNDQACGDQSSVSWFSELGVTYRIAVHGYATHEGSFTISLEEPLIVVSPECNLSSALEVDGVSVLGSTIGVVSDLPSECGVQSDSGPGVWYSVRGAGRRITASTCLSSGDSFTNTTVFVGGCDSLSCVQVVKSPCGFHHASTWTAETDVEYFILIQGKSTIDLGSQFVVYVEDSPGNDFCDNAIGPIEADGSLTYGSTRSATPDNLFSLTSRGIWYTVLGTGTRLSATTCSEFTNFNSDLRIYQGVSCVDANEVETTTVEGCQLTKTWTSVEGEVYYLLVGGMGDEDFGNFALSISVV